MMKIIYGGRKSGRTYAIAKHIVNHYQKDKEILIASHNIDSAKDLHKLVDRLMQEEGIEGDNPCRIITCPYSLLGRKSTLYVDNFDLLHEDEKREIMNYGMFNRVYAIIKIDRSIEVIPMREWK